MTSPLVLTLIAAPGALPATLPARIRAALGDMGAIPGTPEWLAEGEACDLPFLELAPDQAVSIARSAIGDLPVDAIAQPAEGRRKRLLLADMDSTIVTSETLDEIAAYAGLKAEVAAITARSMNGEIDFSAALRERVALLKGLDVAALQKTWEATEYSAGARELIATLAADGAVTALVSGGFTWFTGRVAEGLGFTHHFANTLEIEADALLGSVSEPILDRDAKLAILKRLAAENGLALTATAAVGDGANDLAMLGAAGLGVAYRAKPIVAQAARARLDHAGLRGLLFAMGYAAQDIKAG